MFAYLAQLDKEPAPSLFSCVCGHINAASPSRSAGRCWGAGGQEARGITAKCYKSPSSVSCVRAAELLQPLTRQGRVSAVAGRFTCFQSCWSVSVPFMLQDVKVFSEDGTSKVVEILADMTARDLCQLLVYKSHCVDDNSWTLVEHHPHLGLGRERSKGWHGYLGTWNMCDSCECASSWNVFFPLLLFVKLAEVTYMLFLYYNLMC